MLEILTSCAYRRGDTASLVHPTRAASTPDLSPSTLKCWCDINHTAQAHHTVAFSLVFLPPNKLLYAFFFSSPGFPNEYCEAYINKEMKHSSSRLRRKYHNCTNNINNLEKTLEAVNTLIWVVKGLGHIPVWSNRQLGGLLTNLGGRLHFSATIQKWYQLHGNKNMGEPKQGKTLAAIKKSEIKELSAKREAQ